MPIKTTCPGCKALFRLPEELAGKQVRCQKCAQMFMVPLPNTGTSVPAAVPEEPPPTPIEALHEEPILATVVGDAAPTDEPILATVVEPSEKKTPTDAKPPLPKPKSPPPAERPVSIAMILAMIGLFSAAMLGTGAFAAIWVAGHLSAPLHVMVVPPLHAGANVNMNLGFVDRNPKRGDRINFDMDKAKDLGNDRFFKENPQPKRPDLVKLQRIIATIGDNDEYEDKRALTLKDPVDPSVPVGGPYKVYLVQLEADQVYIFDMKSDDFTTRLTLFDPDNKLIRIGVKNLQMTYKPARSGTYSIHAASSNKDRGAYTLTILRQAKDAGAMPALREIDFASTEPRLSASCRDG